MAGRNVEDADTDVKETISQTAATRDHNVFTSFEEVSQCLHGDREAANDRLGHILRHGARSPTEELVRQHLTGELFHVKFVRAAMESLDGSSSNHDWSKDLVYMATAGLAFSFKRADLVKDILDREMERHYELEDHHMESMDYTGQLMSDSQLLEVAVDRLSRNLQFNQGEVDLQQMLSFEPRMRKCPVCGEQPRDRKCQHEEELLVIYWRHVYKVVDLVKEKWNSMVEGQMSYLKV